MFTRHRIIILLLATVLLGGVLATLVGNLPKEFDIQDPTYDFRLCAITRGTNHNVYTGFKLLGMLNRKLIQSGGGGTRRISRDQMYTIVTFTNTALLSVAYLHDGDVLRSNKNGYYYPINVAKRLLSAAIVIPPSNQAITLSEQGGNYSPHTKEYLNCWIIPATITNLNVCELHLTRKENKQPVATYRLR